MAHVKSSLANSTSGQIKKIDFIREVFGHIHEETATQLLVCGFPDDPKASKKWKPKTLKKGKVPSDINNKNNCYFNIATYHSDNGKYRAIKNRVAAIHVIVLDDIGTKVKKKLKKLMLLPSWVTETSPGNYQVGYILETPCMDLDLYDSVIKALVKAGWTDPGSSGSTRWFRMPFGVNTKVEHLTDNGAAPKVRLKKWHPERRYSIEQIINTFELNIVSHKTHSTSINNEKRNDPVLSAIKDAGLWKSELEPGKHDMTCPWVHSHTDHTDHGSAYFEQSKNNQQLGGYKCQHGHCATRGIADLKKYLSDAVGLQKSKSHLETTIDIADKIPVFQNENGETFGFIDRQCRPLNSREVRAHIFRTVKSTTGAMVKNNNLSEALSALEGKALSEGKELKLYNRIAIHKNYFWYDLGNNKAIRVKKNSWKVVKAPKLFRRYSHQQVQITPVTGGNPWRLFNFLNISKAHRLETLVLLISYLVPAISHPIFHPHGAQGSGKTTLCKMIKMLIDPSSLEVILATKNKTELIRQINRHHVFLLDNMSKIDSEMSDLLCSACTGAGIAKRQLYTDDDDCVYNFKRCIGLNGINLLITKPDLLDRTMLLHLERISPKKRKEEVNLLREFEKAKPEILGGMFDVLARAMALHPEVKLKRLPRMADFAKWGYAIAESLEKGCGRQFMRDYQSNVKRQSAEVLRNNSLCLAVKLLMENEKEWEGTVKAAFEALSLIVEPSKADNTFPADAKNLRKHLERIQTTLAESEQITYYFTEKPKRDGYHIVFTKSK